MFAFRCGDRFIINHVSFDVRSEKHVLRFWESHDLREWRYLSPEKDNFPDANWYRRERAARWDHMYLLPKHEDDLNTGYWRYCVGTPSDDKFHGSCGLRQSPDDINGKPFDAKRSIRLEGSITACSVSSYDGCKTCLFKAS